VPAHRPASVQGRLQGLGRQLPQNHEEIPANPVRTETRQKQQLRADFFGRSASGRTELRGWRSQERRGSNPLFRTTFKSVVYSQNGPAILGPFLVMWSSIWSSLERSKALLAACTSADVRRNIRSASRKIAGASSRCPSAGEVQRLRDRCATCRAWGLGGA
jgi:hypothetical protein